MVQVPKMPEDTTRITRDFVAKLCKSKGFFSTPELNEKLYLHFFGFQRIEGLDEFINCRVLWLENNLIEAIEGIEKLTMLDTLYLQNNMVRSLQHDLHHNSLRVLNVSHNLLISLSGVERFCNLQQLHVSHNSLQHLDGLELLRNLNVLDISHNLLKESAEVLRALLVHSQLCSLMMNGNEFIRTVNNYRKVVISQHRQLKYLDEYPVFDVERRCSEAFVAGGPTEERVVRDHHKVVERQKQSDQRTFFDHFVDEAKQRRCAGDTTYYREMEHSEKVEEPVGEVCLPIDNDSDDTICAEHPEAWVDMLVRREYREDVFVADESEVLSRFELPLELSDALKALILPQKNNVGAGTLYRIAKNSLPALLQQK